MQEVQSSGDMFKSILEAHGIRPTDMARGASLLSERQTAPASPLEKAIAEGEDTASSCLAYLMAPASHVAVLPLYATDL